LLQLPARFPPGCLCFLSRLLLRLLPCLRFLFSVVLDAFFVVFRLAAPRLFSAGGSPRLFSPRAFGILARPRNHCLPRPRSQLRRF
jgi:hypothetical protein